jgi:nicotinamidase-related amidase
VIDAQESFRHRNYWHEDGAKNFIENTQCLVEGAERAGLKIAQIFHTAKSDPKEVPGPFDPKGDFVCTLSPLKINPEVAFHKKAHSAAIGTGLIDWLKENDVHRVLISGIRTEQCCETTARHLSDVGFKVDFVSEATLTFDMEFPDGRILAADQIKERTELVLRDRFAKIVTVDQALLSLERNNQS